MTNITSQHLQTNPFLCRSCRIAGIVHARRLLVRQGRHSISSAQAQDTHQRHHSKQQIKPAIPHVDARFRKHRHKKRISGIAANSKSKPPTLQANTRFRKHRHKKRISGVATNSKSKPALPRVDARFRKHPYKKHISHIASNGKSKTAVRPVAARFCEHPASTQQYRKTIFHVHCCKFSCSNQTSTIPSQRDHEFPSRRSVM